MEDNMESNKVSKALLGRLPRYLEHLKSLPASGGNYISSAAVATALGLGHVLVRKDFAKVSDGGHPKTGYLRRELGRALNLRYTPELAWELDDSITYGAKMLEIINNLPYGNHDDEE